MSNNNKMVTVPSFVLPANIVDYLAREYAKENPENKIMFTEQAIIYLAKALPKPIPEFKVGQVWRNKANDDFLITAVVFDYKIEVFSVSHGEEVYYLKYSRDFFANWTLMYDPDTAREVNR